MSLRTLEVCGSDIFEAIRLLSENDTIETLKIIHRNRASTGQNCIFKERLTEEDQPCYMKRFHNLKKSLY